MSNGFQVNDYDQTVQIFDNFYTPTLTVPTAEWDVVYSWFVGVSVSRNTASALASVLFRIAQESDVQVMSLLEDLQGKSNTQLELSQSMAFYLNLVRTKTALYGVSQVPPPNQTIQRNILS